MSTTSPEDLARITDYVVGEMSPAQSAETARWIAENEGRKKVVDYLRRARESHRGAIASTLNVEERVQALLTRTMSPAQSERVLSEVKSASFGRSSRKSGAGLFRTLRDGIRGLGTPALLGAFGTVAVLAIVIGLSRFGSHHDTGTTRMYATTITQSASFTLSDGTQVTLSPGTTLRLANFGMATRTVFLDGGEAFFDVSRSSGVPFIVRSGQIDTRVLGTSFLVHRSANNKGVHVSVVSGRVNVTGAVLGDSSLLLSAGHIGDITDTTARTGVAVDDAPEAVLEDGQMVFRHAPVTQVLAALARWYGYQFRCPDSAVSHLRVTVWMSTRSSSEALAMLEQILGVNLTVVGDTVTLMPHSGRTDRKMPRSNAYDVWTPNREVGR